MQTDQSLLGLYRVSSSLRAARCATNPDDFDLKVKGIFSSSEMTWETSGQPLPAPPPGRSPGGSSGGPFFKKG